MRARQHVPLPERPAPSKATHGTALEYLEARRHLAGAGIDFPRAYAVRTPEEVRARLGSVEGPFVLKAGWIEHKTEAGAVAVGLADAGAVVDALVAMRERLGDGGYVVELLDRRAGVVELFVGARRDPSFGPVVMVGGGGVTAELYRDSRLAVAPVSVEQARTMLEELRCHPLLTGWRGRPAMDVGAAAEAVSSVSMLIAQDPDLVEVEVNPLRVAPSGAMGGDAVVIRTDTAGPNPAELES